MKALTVIFMLLATAVFAEGTVSAAGRLEVDKGFCSAALVAPNLVLTAAHCIAEGSEGVVFRPNSVTQQSFAVSEIVRHPLYQQENKWRFRFDFALARLATAVPRTVATPFTIGAPAELGEKLFLLSWRDDEPPRQRACPVLEGAAGLVTLGCNVRGGESGAPLLRKTSNGLELIAVISSRGWQKQQPIAQASDIELRLEPMIDIISD